MPDSLSYSAAGVDIGAGERAVELMRSAVESTRRAELVGGLGGFAGLFDISGYRGWRRPLLATSTDGVGTKLRVAQLADRHGTVGIDLVAMTADDLVVCGAEPLFLTDYIACGKVVPERIAAIVEGIAEGCRQAGIVLIGGETAEHPGVMEVDEYDLAAAATGVVEADQLLGAERVEAGDAVIAMASSGLHSNGYSLARKVFFELGSWTLDREMGYAGKQLVDELLEPTRIYAKACLELIAQTDIHAFAHITGGGICGNLQRVVPNGLTAAIDRSTWALPPIFDTIQGLGQIARFEMERAFNMGIGMIALAPAHAADAVVSLLGESSIPAWVAGNVVSGDSQVHMASSYR